MIKFLKKIIKSKKDKRYESLLEENRILSNLLYSVMVDNDLIIKKKPIIDELTKKGIDER